MSSQNRTEEGLLGRFVSVGGLVSCGVSVCLWALSQHETGQAQALGLAHSVESLADLRRLFSVLPVLVAVRGRVGSTAPKRCELGDKDAVVHEIVEEEIYRKERENGRVTQEAFEVRRVFSLCEWFLEDSSSSRVRVENANQAERLRSCMDTKQAFFPEEPSKTTLAALILEKAMKSMQKYGVRKTEKFLPVGREVTVIGELSRSPLTWTGLNTNTSNSSGGGSSSSSTQSAGGGAIPGSHYINSAARDAAPEPSAPPFPFSLLSSAAVVYNSEGVAELGSHAMEAGLSFIPFVVRKPATGPFYITPLTLSQLRSSLSSRARTIKYVSYGFGALGAFLIVRKAVNQLVSMHHRHTIRNRVAAAERAHKAAMAARAAAGASSSSSSTSPSGSGIGGQSATDGGVSAEEEGHGAGVCVVCMELPSEMVFTSCGHMCCCYSCGHMMSRCPMCRTRGPTIKVFRS